MSPTVFIVEDDVDTREMLGRFLELEGYRVESAPNGKLALERLGAGVGPCVILLDLMMPVMDGASFRQVQRENPRLASIPVVVLTAYRDMERHAAPLDAVSVLRKPPSVRELVNVLRTHC